MHTLTVVIPTYNLGTYLKPMLDDLAAQTVPLELWLVDDGSSDETPRVIRDFAQGRDWVHTEFFAQHRSVGAARNYGLAHATGSVIAFVDGDDLIKPTFAESLLAGFTPGVVAVAVGYDWWSRPRRQSSQYQLLTQAQTFDQVSQHGTEIGGYVWNKAFLVSELRQRDIVYDVSLPIAEDYLFVADYVAHVPGQYAYLPTVLYTKRNRPNSTIHTVGRDARWQERAVFERIAKMRQLIHDD